MPSRRDFLSLSVLGAIGLRLPSPPRSQRSTGSFIDVTRPPDVVVVEAARRERLTAAGGRWRGAGLAVVIDSRSGASQVRLSAPGAAVKRIELRWRGSTAGVRAVLGDAWERGYGDFEWREIVADRVLPWYCATFVGDATHGYGVRTGAAAFCFWQIDDGGITLAADVRSGGAPLQLGERTLDVCAIVAREGRTGESAFAALRALCGALCTSQRRRASPVIGSNDWYYAYGNNSAASFLADARRIAELSPAGSTRPFAVVDDGWQPERQDKRDVGVWNRGNGKFGEMTAVADAVARAGARPGIWIRPLLSAGDTPDRWRLSRSRAVLDPTVPDALKKITEDVAGLREWGFELIKHDYTTFDLSGRWGFQMDSSLTEDGWTFAEGPTRTTAEVITGLYAVIRAAAKDAVVVGCNTVSHLSAGVFDICRIGDDTSGTDWARTRKMGVNSLAFRGVQHGAFYVADADCAPVTAGLPWTFGREWLDLVARSGTALFVSLAPDALTTERKADVRAALARAARPEPLAEPLDWMHTITPTRWLADGGERRYRWIDE